MTPNRARQLAFVLPFVGLLLFSAGAGATVLGAYGAAQEELGLCGKPVVDITPPEEQSVTAGTRFGPGFPRLAYGDLTPAEQDAFREALRTPRHTGTIDGRFAHVSAFRDGVVITYEGEEYYGTVATYDRCVSVGPLVLPLGVVGVGAGVALFVLPNLGRRRYPSYGEGERPDPSRTRTAERDAATGLGTGGRTGTGPGVGTRPGIGTDPGSAGVLASARAGDLTDPAAFVAFGGGLSVALAPLALAAVVAVPLPGAAWATALVGGALVGVTARSVPRAFVLGSYLGVAVALLAVPLLWWVGVPVESLFGAGWEWLLHAVGVSPLVGPDAGPTAAELATLVAPAALPVVGAVAARWAS